LEPLDEPTCAIWIVEMMDGNIHGTVARRPG
jgi:hypothetical protein